MKALVTGCAGFIGSNLSDFLLKKGYEVTGIDSLTDYYSSEIKISNIETALKNKNFNFIERDILDFKKFPQVDVVFHMAAQAGVRSSWGEYFVTYISNNIEATQKLLEYYKDQKIKKFIYSSSSSVYGDSKLPMNEESLLKPVSPYGVSKLAAENLCYLYWKNYSVPTISLRYFTVYGPRQRPDMAINKFVDSIINQEEIVVFGDGEQTRDFTYIGDVINLIIKAAYSKFEGEIFNVGGGNKISVNDLINEIQKIVGIQSIVKYEEKQKGDVKNTLSDVRKTKKLLGWEPKTDVTSGLRNYIEWYKNL